MKVAIDCRPLVDIRTGIGRSTFELLSYLLKAGGSEEYFLVGLKPNLVLISKKDAVDSRSLDLFIKNRTVRVPQSLDRTLRILIYLYTKHFSLKTTKPDVLLGTNYFGFFGPSFKTVLTIHDMAYSYSRRFVSPYMYKVLTRRLLSHARQADAIIAVSQTTRRDIIDFLGIPSQKVHVVYPGVHPKFRAIHDRQTLANVRNKYSLPQKFILFVGTLEPRKNVKALVEAFHRLTRMLVDHCLVIVGKKGPELPELLQKINDLCLGERITFCGYVSDEDLPALYNLATTLVCPSFYEGFGFPVLEAMACGTPVAISNAPALREVAEDAALYFDPHSFDDLASVIYMTLTDTELRTKLRERGMERAANFSWDRCAEHTLDLLRFLADK